MKNKVLKPGWKALLAVVVVLGLCFGGFYYLQSPDNQNDDDKTAPPPLATASPEVVSPNAKDNPGKIPADEDKRDDAEKNKSSKRQSGSNNIEKGTIKDIEKPSGIFVSSHTATLTEALASTCITTPGAQCTIRFTKDGVIKSLNIQNTDREGAAYWNWTPEKIGLGKGIWAVEAIATYENMKSSAKDLLDLRIEQ